MPSKLSWSCEDAGKLEVLQSTPDIASLKSSIPCSSCKLSEPGGTKLTQAMVWKHVRAHYYARGFASVLIHLLEDWSHWPYPQHRYSPIDQIPFKQEHAVRIKPIKIIKILVAAFE